MVRDLHDPNSATLPRAIDALKQGSIVIFDLSRMRGSSRYSDKRVVFKQIFDRNLESHTSGDLIPCIAVIEEAQKVLSGTQSGDAHPVFVEWTKEGRKYGLGSVIVTQQPGVIDMEILSQSDTTFAFHVISKADLRALQSANAHSQMTSCQHFLMSRSKAKGISGPLLQIQNFPIRLVCGYSILVRCISGRSDGIIEASEYNCSRSRKTICCSGCA